MTLTELAEQAGLSRRTNELILDSLIEAGWVAELDRVPTSGCAGRPARRYQLRAEHALLAAVRISTPGRVRGGGRRPRPYPRPGTAPAARLPGSAVHARRRGGPGTGGTRRRGRLAGPAARRCGRGRRRDRRRGCRTRRLGAHHALGGRAAARRTRAARPDALVRRQRHQPSVRWPSVGWALAGDHDNVVWAGPRQPDRPRILIRGAVHRGLDGAAGEIIEGALDTGRLGREPPGRRAHLTRA
ncbi:hypothetical protein ACRAWF_41510 [Streptomyces sp. L7]